MFQKFIWHDNESLETHSFYINILMTTGKIVFTLEMNEIETRWVTIYSTFLVKNMLSYSHISRLTEKNIS